MTEHTLSLPAWLKPVEGKPGWVTVDPDGAYPEWLALLGIDAPDQFDMEVAHHCIKMDAQVKCRMFGIVPPKNGALHITIRGEPGSGYKDRWAARNKPAGKLADVAKAEGGGPQKALRKVALHARERYRAIRGTLPG